MTPDIMRFLALRHWRIHHAPGVSRRDLILKSVGAVGLLLGSRMLTSCGGELDSGERHTADAQAKKETSTVLPRPIPAGNLDPTLTDVARVNDPSVGPGIDASTIFDFRGDIATSILSGTGVGTDASSPRGRTQSFMSDMRVMSGRFMGVDGRRNEGTFGLL